MFESIKSVIHAQQQQQQIVYANEVDNAKILTRAYRTI